MDMRKLAEVPYDDQNRTIIRHLARCFSREEYIFAESLTVSKNPTIATCWRILRTFEADAFECKESDRLRPNT